MSSFLSDLKMDFRITSSQRVVLRFSRVSEGQKLIRSVFVFRTVEIFETIPKVPVEGLITSAGMSPQLDIC